MDGQPYNDFTQGLNDANRKKALEALDNFDRDAFTQAMVGKAKPSAIDYFMPTGKFSKTWEMFDGLIGKTMETYVDQQARERLAPTLEQIQSVMPSLRPTPAQMQTVEGPRPTGPGFTEVPAEGPGLPQQRDLLSTDAFLRTLSPQEQAVGRFQQELNQRGPGAYQEGLRPTTLQPTGADVELYGPGAPIQRQIPGVKPNMAQLQAAQSILAGHTVDPRASLVPSSLQIARETPVEMNPGNVLTTKQGQPLYTAPGKPIKDNEELRKFQGVLEAAGIVAASPMGKQLYTEWAKKIANPAPSTQVTTNVNTEKKYGEIFSSKVAENDVSMMDAAHKAPELADRANRIRQLLATSPTITGVGAEFRLNMAKAMKLAGLSSDDAIENTETLVAELSSNTLDAIKASGLGAGNGFSNADRDFLEKARGGKITMEKGSLSRLAELAHRAADQSVQRWNTRAKAIPQSALEGTGITRDPVSVPPITIYGDDDWARLPKGTRFVGPDGKARTK